MNCLIYEFVSRHCNDLDFRINPTEDPFWEDRTSGFLNLMNSRSKNSPEIKKGINTASWFMQSIGYELCVQFSLELLQWPSNPKEFSDELLKFSPSPKRNFHQEFLDRLWQFRYIEKESKKNIKIIFSKSQSIPEFWNLLHTS
jgi:hypothetical protein